MSDRGMMKWAPYKSLIEQESALNKAKREKAKVAKPQMSSDVAESIDYLLRNYHNQEIKLTYWLNGYIIIEVGVISKINVNERIILINRKHISFDSFINLEEK